MVIKNKRTSLKIKKKSLIKLAEYKYKKGFSSYEQAILDLLKKSKNNSDGWIEEQQKEGGNGEEKKEQE